MGWIEVKVKVIKITLVIATKDTTSLQESSAKSKGEW